MEVKYILDNINLDIDLSNFDELFNFNKNIQSPVTDHKQSLINKITNETIPENISLKDYYWQNNWFTPAGNKLFNKFTDIMYNQINDNLITFCPELKNTNLSINEIQKYIYNPLIDLKDNIKNDLIPQINKFSGNINDDYIFIYMRCLNRYFDKDNFILQRAIKNALSNIDIDESQTTSLRLIIKKIMPQITEYLNNNLDDLLPRLAFPQKENGTYNFSWQNNFGGYNFSEDCKPVVQYMQQHINDILNINLSNMKNINEDWNYILNQYIHKYLPKDIGLKIRNYIIHLNDSIITKRAEALETNNDKKNDITTIDYDPADDHEREKPIIIYRVQVNNQNKDLVIVGQQGSSHGATLNREFVEELQKLNLPVELEDKNMYTQAYLLGKVAFIDKKMYNTYNSWEEVQQILINDPRIEKIYTTPPTKQGGEITRLAKIVNNYDFYKSK